MVASHDVKIRELAALSYVRFTKPTGEVTRSNMEYGSPRKIKFFYFWNRHHKQDAIFNFYVQLTDNELFYISCI